ncbi:MAG: heme lyase CcmF/NrfE family subunit, partial [Geminicoccaceae bacterium]
FAFAIAALIGGRLDATWARWSRPWTTLAWSFLTIGIMIGSWWAYYELGWGGWWFWDPVENASFMPWLAATALLHSAIVVEKRDALKSWTILLAILAFSLSLLGTFLVRSGVLTSVHAFATDPARGVFILALLGIAIGGSLLLYAWRAPSLQGGGVFAPISREGGLLLNNLLLATAAATVLLGTLYPLALDTIGGSKISVGAPFFNATFVPLMVPLFIAVPFGSMLAWKRGDLAGVTSRLSAAMLVTAAAMLLWLGFHDFRASLAMAGIGLGVWVIAGTLNELVVRLGGTLPLDLGRILGRARGLPRSAWAMSMAHVGLGVLILGITVQSAGQVERILVMRPGETTQIVGYDVRFDGVGEVQGPNYTAKRATFAVTRGGEPVTVLSSERRYFPVEQMPTTEAGIASNLWRDLYFVLGDPADNGGFAVRLYYNPLVLWIWGGAAIMALAGLVSLTDRRLRVGAPRPARLPPRAAPAGA